MLKNKLAPIAFLLLALGCAGPRRERVYVDFDAVLAAYSSSPLPATPVPPPPTGLPPRTATVGAVPGKTILVEGAPEIRAQALLEANRKNAVQEMSRLLAKRYVREVERSGTERIKALDPKRAAAFEEAQNEIRADFEAYAQSRGGKLAELTSLVGFPDPNPASLPPSSPVPEFVQKRLGRAADLRHEITALDDAYQARLAKVLAAVATRYNVDLAAIQSDLEKDRVAAFSRAESEATREAANTYKSLAPLIMGGAKVTLPPQPAQSVTLPPVLPPISAPKVREKTLSLAQRREVLRDQLQIWLGLNGYTLSTSPDGVPNVTSEFVRWRKERNL